MLCYDYAYGGEWHDITLTIQEEKRKPFKFVLSPLNGCNNRTRKHPLYSAYQTV